MTTIIFPGDNEGVRTTIFQTNKSDARKPR